jgi:hypothetical protein
VGTGERFWTSRLRWRLRGAMQWPAFVVCTLVDGVILDLLPPVSTTGLNLVEGVLIATFGNLVLIGALAPFLARRLARRSAERLAGAPPDATVPPAEAERDVLQDRVATVMLVAGVAAALVSGLANRPVIVSETEATEEVARQVQAYVAHSGSEELRRNLETAHTVRLGKGYFRSCIARDDRRRRVCLLIDTNASPTRVKRDPSGEPNSAYTGP